MKFAVPVGVELDRVRVASVEVTYVVDCRSACSLSPTGAVHKTEPGAVGTPVANLSSTELAAGGVMPGVPMLVPEPGVSCTVGVAVDAPE
ncbi:hypothetical protein ABZ917_17465 [Nonomuraea wenchangensis]